MFTPTSQTLLTMAIRGSIYELDEPLRDVLELVFDDMQRHVPLNISAIATKLNLSYAATYERFGKGLIRISRSLAANPLVAECIQIDIPETVDQEQIVMRVLQAFRS